MATPTFVPQALDFSGIERGIARKEARAESVREQGRQGIQDQRATETFELNKQIALDNQARQQKQDEQTLVFKELDSLENSIKTEKNPEAIRIMGARTNELRKKAFGEEAQSIDFNRLSTDAATMKQFQRDLISFTNLEETRGEDDPVVQQVQDAMSIKYGSFPDQLQQIQAVTEPSALEATEAAEGRAEAFDIRKEGRGEIRAAGKSITGLEQAKELSRFQAGLKDSRVKDNIDSIPIFDEVGTKVGETPVLYFRDEKIGKMVYEEIKKFVPPAQEGASPTPAPQAADVTDVNTAVNFSFEEYKASLSNTQGLSDEKLKVFYLEEVNDGKLVRPKHKVTKSSVGNSNRLRTEALETVEKQSSSKEGISDIANLREGI